MKINDKYTAITFCDFGDFYRAIINDICIKFGIYEIDKFLKYRSTVQDYIIKYFYENREIFTNKDLFDLSSKEKNLIGELIGDKFIHYFNVKFESDIQDILFNGLPFPHKSFAEMALKIEERRL